MVNRRWTRPAPLLYGLAWAVAAPALLVVWAVATADLVPLPPIRSALAGPLLGGVGLLLMASAMAALAVHGGGPPMNAYPPPRLVTRGPYRWTGHPIYIGFILLAAGVSVFTGSASGLWLVTPVAALALAALVLGYERHDLRQRFGAMPRPLLSLPAARAGTATSAERASIYVLVLLPWLLAYEALHVIGVPRDAIPSHFAFERGWPVLEWTEAIYASAYAMILLTPLLVRSRPALRRFALMGLMATALVTFIYILVPLVAPPRPFEPTTALGRLLALERSVSNTVAAFPAFHVLWPLIATAAWRTRGEWWGRAALAWAVLIAASCITTGMHSLVDVAAAFVIYPLFGSAPRVWESLRRGAERIANSWREWRAGPVRILNHGFYTAAGGAVGAWITGVVAGPELMGAVVTIAVLGLVTAALWAQLLEGSPALLRPLGFYGGIIGGLLGVGMMALLRLDFLPVLLGFALAMPWVQAAGRLRCLVQGCCHGGPAPPSVGIRYGHSRSRVMQIAGLACVPLHPTPLYSILANVATGLLLLRLQVLGATAGLIVGVYYILNAVARFVEESYRAEPQTPIVARLRIYQWLALLGFLAGVAFTVTGRTPLPFAAHPLDPLLLLGSVLVGVTAWFITGVDFPESNRRFSRLAAADSSPRMLAIPVAVRPFAAATAAVQDQELAAVGADEDVAIRTAPDE
jgi:protein-S-isoprenylcysteine O-methyltransferase Ste14